MFPGVSVPGGAGPASQDTSPQACTLLLLVLFIYDVFFVFITPFLTKVGGPALPLLRCLYTQPSAPTLMCPPHPMSEWEQYHGRGGNWARGLRHTREGMFGPWRPEGSVAGLGWPAGAASSPHSCPWS